MCTYFLSTSLCGLRKWLPNAPHSGFFRYSFFRSGEISQWVRTPYPSIRTGFRFSGPSHIHTPIIGSWGPGEKVEAHRPSSPASSTSRRNKPGSHRVGWAMLSSWICFVGFTAPSSIRLSVSSQHRSVGKSVPVTSCICYLPVLWLLERQPLDCHLKMSTELTTEIASGEATLPGLGWSHCLGRRSCLQTPSQEDMEPRLPVESALELSVFYGNILGVNHVFVDVPCPSHTVGGSLLWCPLSHAVSSILGWLHLVMTITVLRTKVSRL